MVLSYSVQCNSYFGQAVPTNRSDPLLVNWTANHVVGHKAPNTGGFRDPSRAWLGPDGSWRQLLGCGGASCLYSSADFESWQYVGHMFGDGQGPTWEMPDIVNLSTGALFMKVGMENGTDYWTTGRFDYATNKFVTGTGVTTGGYSSDQQCDYGMFYSSKTFAGVARPVLIGWVGEGPGSPLKDWAGLQSIPRLVTADPQRAGRVLFYPIDLSSLHESSTKLSNTPIAPGQAYRLQGIEGSQLDLTAVFNGPFPIGTSFGLGVLESTVNVTVTIESGQTGTLSVGGHTGPFPLEASGAVHLRVLVDHSIVEAFVNNGTACATARAYPGSAQATGVYLMNQGSATVQMSDFTGYTVRAATPPSIEELRAHAKSRGRRFT